MPITRSWCLAQRHEGGETVTWSEEYLERYRADVAAGREGGSYTVAHVAQVRGALRAHAAAFRGGRVVVIGTDRPWIEVMLLDEGAARVLTFEYAAIVSQHPRVEARACRDVAADFLAGAFEPADAVVSYSSIEHSGLGRYGDALDPNADADALAQAWCSGVRPALSETLPNLASASSKHVNTLTPFRAAAICAAVRPSPWIRARGLAPIDSRMRTVAA
jgi:hypothetical protein